MKEHLPDFLENLKVLAKHKADFTENAEAALMILERTLEEKAG